MENKKVDLGLELKHENNERTPNDFYNYNIIKGFLCITLAFIIVILFDFVWYYADEYDSKEIAEKMFEIGAYDIIQENKEEYPYYMFSDYSVFNNNASFIPSGENHRGYNLVLFSKPPANGVYTDSGILFDYYFKLSETGNTRIYNYSGSSWSLTFDQGNRNTVGFCSNALLGSNFSICNSDGSYFFGLTSQRPILTVSSIKRTLLKPIVYLIPFAVVSAVLVISFLKAWEMLRTVLARV